MSQSFKMTWKKWTENDFTRKLIAVDHCEELLEIRYAAAANHAAIWRGPTDVNDAPVPAHPV